MTTPEAKFVARCEATIEELALLYAHSGPEAIEPSLDGYKQKVVAGLLQILGGNVKEEHARAVDEIADCIVERIMARRREIEAASASSDSVM